MPPHISHLDPEVAAGHRPRLLAVARSLGASPHLAEDLTQETYARVLAKPRPLGEGADFPYLVRPCATCSTITGVPSSAARWSSARSTEDQPSLSAERDPEAAAIAGEVYTAVAGLPDEFRRVVAAVDVLGLSYGQTARSLRIPQGTVMSRLSRGRSRVICALT